MKNKKYSLLIVALYCYSGHVKSVIDHLMAHNPLIDLTLLTDKPEEIKKLLIDKTVRIESYNVSPVNCRYRWLRFWMIKHKQRQFFSKFSKNRKYDIVNIHFPNRYMLFVLDYLRSMSDNIVITPWGSDILRVKYKKALDQLSKLYRSADYVATDSKTPLGKRIIEELKVEPNKLVGNFFGSDVIDFSNKYGNAISQETAKSRFELTGRYVITCGYNKREVHQHKVIIEAIDKVKNLLPNNLTLLFPMTYGPNTRDDYVTECIFECEKRHLNALFVTDYLSIEDLYKLRKATDMFIHLQLTDASSSSVQEYVLCNAKIVHGSWIKYEIMESFSPLFYYPVDKLEDLSEVIIKAFKSDSIIPSKGLIDYVKGNGWENKVSKMNDFFMSII